MKVTSELLSLPRALSSGVAVNLLPHPPPMVSQTAVCTAEENSRASQQTPEVSHRMAESTLPHIQVERRLCCCTKRSSSQWDQWFVMQHYRSWSVSLCLRRFRISLLCRVSVLGSKCVASMCRKQKVAVTETLWLAASIKAKKKKKKRTTRKERKKGLTL